MIFPIVQVTGGIDMIYDVPLVFFENAQNVTVFSESLFPIWFRPVYRRCPGVKDKFEDVFKSFRTLSRSKQRVLIDVYRNSKDIKKICSDKTNIYLLASQLEKKIRTPLSDLFQFLFDSTLGTDIFKKVSGMHIDDHYTAFQLKNNLFVCPFCGLETYTLPKFRRAEYDHFLPISIYPWLGVNLNNLVPMGGHCNGKKNKQNILYSDTSARKRREAWYPYEWVNHSIVLINRKRPTLYDINGKWEVLLKATTIANDEKVNTWNDVFEISSRFENTIATFHKRFIEDFAHKNCLQGQKLTILKLKSELRKYRDNRIGDIKLEPLAKLKYIWANYYIKEKDSSHFAIISQTIAYLRTRKRP